MKVQEGFNDGYERLMNGGFGLSPICVPTYLPRLIITIIFPPLGVILEQYHTGFKNPQKIITSIILTSMFYFPGLLHALYGLDCGHGNV